MTRRQETLIYIEKENTTEAEFMSRNFVNQEVKNKAYINALGAELVLKYLSSEGIDVSNLHNIHSISKILEKYDIADILLPNIHIDVRVVLDENKIFIPKKHFELEITPDIYIVLKLEKNFKHAELLGYFKTSKINKKNENNDYYFISKDKLTNPDSLAKFIKNFTGKTSRNISEEDMFRGRELSVALADHNISYDEEKELLELLLLNDSLRESVLEFDNFETLAYSVAPELAAIEPAAELTFISGDNLEDESSNNIEDIQIDSDEELALNETFFDNFETLTEDEPQEENLNEEVNENENIDKTDLDTETSFDIETSSDNEEDNNKVSFENIEQKETDQEPIIETEPNETIENILEPENIDLGDDLLGEDLPTGEDVLPSEFKTATIEKAENETNLETIEETSPTNIEEPSLPEPVNTPVELSVDSILDNTIAAIDTNNENTENKEEKKKDINNDLAEILGNAVQGVLEKTATVGTIAATAAAAEITAEAATTSQEAIKLASIAGDLVDNIVGENLEKQQKNLDKIDYQKTDIAPDTIEIPENIAILGEDLSAIKKEANLEVEISGQFDTPTDLSDLNTVETYEEQVFEHETIDINAMDSVQTEEFSENTDEIVNLENITEIDSPTRPIENLAEINTEEDFTGMDLPDLSSYTINEDGSSSLDNLDTSFALEENSNEHLIDMKMNINEISLDNDIEPLTLDSSDIINSEDLTSFDNQTQVQDTNEDLFNHFEENTLAMDDQNQTVEDTQDNFLEDLSFEDFSENNEEFNQLDEPIFNEDETPSNTPLEEENKIQENFKNITEDEFQQDEDIFGDNTELFDDLQTLGDIENEVLTNESNNFEEQPTNQETIQPEVKFDLNNETENIEPEQTLDQDAQNWMEDTDYENLEDVEIEAPTPIDEFITEPEAVQKEFIVNENSTVISDRTFTVGEIPIDINNTENISFEGAENLQDLYNPNSSVPGGALLNNPGRLGNVQNKSGLGIGLGITGTIVTLALVGAIGFGVAKMFKTPTEEAPQPITDDALPTSTDNGVSETNTLNVNPDNVVNMENNTNTLATTTPSATSKASTVSQVPAQATKTGNAQQFINIKKLTWEVPDYISYNPQFKQYFQSVGKSLKLSLTSDLLLAKDYLYSSQVRVSVTFSKDGTFTNSQIIVSSGSNEIDKIVLQTVNQTLKTLKAPHSVGNDENTTAILKIYF